MHLLRVSMGCSSLSSTATWIETDNIDCLEPRGLYIPVQSLDVADVALVHKSFSLGYGVQKSRPACQETQEPAINLEPLDEARPNANFGIVLK